MNTLICTVGLPYSGKSTWAKTMPYPIVSPDALRLSLLGHRFWAPGEPMVWAMTWAMCRALFIAGCDTVILDETATTHKRREEAINNGFVGVGLPVLKADPDLKNSGWVTVFHHITTDYKTCLNRAADEADLVMIPIITRMHDQFEPLDTNEERFLPL